MLVEAIVTFIAIAAIGAALIIAIRPWRRAVLTRAVFQTYKSILPQMSDTEREALGAGTVWWEGELFRGNPDWKKLLAMPVPRLSAEEQSFMDNEVEQACALVNDWEVTTQLHDLSPEAWKFIKDKGFLGLIIPKKYGGLEFSAYGPDRVKTQHKKLTDTVLFLAVSLKGGSRMAELVRST